MKGRILILLAALASAGCGSVPVGEVSDGTGPATIALTQNYRLPSQYVPIWRN